MRNKEKNRSKHINLKAATTPHKTRKDWLVVNFIDVCKILGPPKKIQTSKFCLTGLYPIIDQSQNEIAGWTNDKTAILEINFPVVIFGDHTCCIKYIDRPFARLWNRRFLFSLL